MIQYGVKIFYNQSMLLYTCLYSRTWTDICTGKTLQWNLKLKYITYIQFMTML